MTRYLVHISAAGSIRYGQLPGSIGVLEALDQSMPIGIASAIGRTRGGPAVWGRNVHGAAVRGRYWPEALAESDGVKSHCGTPLARYSGLR
jgi:hypothetical protein